MPSHDNYYSDDNSDEDKTDFMDWDDELGWCYQSNLDQYMDRLMAARGVKAVEFCQYCECFHEAGKCEIQLLERMWTLG